MTHSPAPSPLRRGYLELPLKRLMQVGGLSSAEEDAVRTLDKPRRSIAKNAAIVSPGTPGFHFLLEGWACRQRELARGRRQLFDLILPGDAIGRLPDDSASARFSWVALTPVLTIEATGLAARDAQGQFVYPGIMDALTKLRTRGQERVLDHMVRLGARSAYDSVADLLLELHDRLDDVGLSSGGRLSFPLGYERVGELLGLSEVHVGRTLTKLKTDGHLQIGPGWLALLRIEDLADHVGYSATLARTYSM